MSLETPLFDDVAGAFYEAALSPDQLQEALSGLAKCAGAQGANFLFADMAAGKPVASVVAQVDQAPEAGQAYNERFCDLDPLAPLAAALPTGAWLNDWRAYGDRGYGRSAYYNEFILPHGNHAVMACVLARGSSRMSLVSLQRARGQSAFSEADEAHLQCLVPHLRRAAELMGLTRELRSRASIVQAALDHLDAAVWIVDAQGKVFLANALAESMTRTDRGFRFASGMLEPRHQTSGAWRAALQRACGVRAMAAWLSVPQPGRASLNVVVAPLAAHSPYAVDFQQPLALVMVRPDASIGLDAAAALKTLYGLTGAEIRVAEQVGAGLSTAQAGERLGVTHSTVRTQLKAVFAKTGVRTQAQLVRLLAGLLSIQGAAAR